MQSLPQPLFDVIMAGETLIRLKKIGNLPAHILGVGMKIRFGNGIVTVLAGGLPMDGGMVSCLVNQPGSAGIPGADTEQDDQTPYCHNPENSAHLEHGRRRFSSLDMDPVGMSSPHPDFSGRRTHVER